MPAGDPNGTAEDVMTKAVAVLFGCAAMVLVLLGAGCTLLVKGLLS